MLSWPMLLLPSGWTLCGTKNVPLSLSSHLCEDVSQNLRHLNNKIITLQANEGIVKAPGKRLSRKSPTGDLANLTTRQDQFETASFRRSDDFSKENRNPTIEVSGLGDKMVSSMNFSSDASGQPIMNVKDRYFMWMSSY